MNVDLTNSEIKVLVEEFNAMLDEGITRAPSLKDPSIVLEIKPLLKKLLIAGLKSGAIKLPACFTGDQELIDAATGT